MSGSATRCQPRSPSGQPPPMPSDSPNPKCQAVPTVPTHPIQSHAHTLTCSLGQAHEVPGSVGACRLDPGESARPCLPMAPSYDTYNPGYPIDVIPTARFRRTTPPPEPPSSWPSRTTTSRAMRRPRPQVFCNHPFRVLGHPGVFETGGQLEFRVHQGKGPQGAGGRHRFHMKTVPAPGPTSPSAPPGSQNRFPTTELRFLTPGRLAGGDGMHTQEQAKRASVARIQGRGS